MNISTKPVYIKSIYLLLLLFSQNSMAGFKRFEAPLDESRWNFAGNPLNCKLTHNIPLYGDAAFEKSAGRDTKLEFKLGYKRHQISPEKKATVRAIAPAWQPLRASRELGEVGLNAGKHIVKSQDIASWRLLNELETGRFPTFFYQDFNTLEDQVSVALSSVGFRAKYDDFLTCLSTLVPFELQELSKMTLYFDFAKSSVRKPYHSKLQALAAYIRFDPSIEVVFINGYTDNKGARGYNQKLSQRRIDSVRRMLSLEGVDNNRFRTLAFGEKKPAATNRNAKGRAQNRRVFIQIAQK